MYRIRYQAIVRSRRSYGTNSHPGASTTVVGLGEQCFTFSGFWVCLSGGCIRIAAIQAATKWIIFTFEVHEIQHQIHRSLQVPLLEEGGNKN